MNPTIENIRRVATTLSDEFSCGVEFDLTPDGQHWFIQSPDLPAVVYTPCRDDSMCGCTPPYRSTIDWLAIMDTSDGERIELFAPTPEEICTAIKMQQIKEV